MMLAKRRVGGRGILTSFILAIASVFLVMAAENGRNPAYLAAVWVAKTDQLIKYSQETGEPVLELDGLTGLHKIAVDSASGSVYAATGVALLRYNFTGKLLLRIPYTDLPLYSEEEMDAEQEDEYLLKIQKILFIPQKNEFFLISRHSIYHLDTTGELKQHLEIDQRIVSAALSAEQDRLWIATKQQILAYTADLQNHIGNIDIAGRHGGATQSLAYDATLQQLWVLAKNNLVRFDIDNQVVFESRLKQANSFTLDQQGNAWLGAGKSLIYLNSQGVELASLQPFGNKGETSVHHIAVDPADQSVWVSGKTALVHVDITGEILDSIDIGKKTRDIALYRDITPPTISFILPSEGSVTNDPTPTIQLLHQDEGTGADPATLAITRDTNPLPVNCTHSLDTSVCDPLEELADGNITFDAVIEDYAGNVSDPATVNFSLDTVPPTINVTAPPNPYSTNNIQLTVTGNLSENAALTLNSRPLTLDVQLGFQTEVELEEGNNTLVLQAIDPAGNTTRGELLVILDTVPPDPAQSSKIAVGQAINGLTTVSGVEGAVEPDAWVEITNTKSSQTSRERAGPGGEFSVSIGAAPADLLQIVVIDQAENSSDPISLQVPVPLSLEVTSPRDGATINGKTVYVEGSYHGLMNTGITVNGVPAAVTPEGTFVSREIELEEGTNSLEVVATTLNGLTVQKSFTVTSDGVSTPLEFTPNVNSGIAPLPAEFELGWYSATEAQSMKIDFNGDGVWDVDGPEMQETYNTTYNEPGIYHATVSITDTDDQVFTKTAVIQVQNHQTMDQLFRSTWNRMNSALISGDLATAAKYLDDFGNRKYQPVFEVLLDQMPQIIASYTSFKQVDINSEVTIYALNRPDGTRNRVYFVYFMQDRAGIWKIHSM